MMLSDTAQPACTCDYTCRWCSSQPDLLVICSVHISRGLAVMPRQLQGQAHILLRLRWRAWSGNESGSRGLHSQQHFERQLSSIKL